MSLLFGSADWLDEMANGINNSEAYAAAAATWEGDICFVCPAGDGQPSDIFMYLDLQHGKCLSHEVVDSAEKHGPEFKLIAPLPTWQQILSGSLDPVKAIMLRKIQLTGPMTKIMRNAKAAVELVNCAAAIDTHYA